MLYTVLESLRTFRITKRLRPCSVGITVPSTDRPSIRPLQENRASRPRKGRFPRCLVLAPTRELANQVSREFESVCPSLKVDSFYGGVSIGAQVGTPPDDFGLACTSLSIRGIYAPNRDLGIGQVQS